MNRITDKDINIEELKLKDVPIEELYKEIAKRWRKAAVLAAPFNEPESFFSQLWECYKASGSNKKKPLKVTISMAAFSAPGDTEQSWPEELIGWDIQSDSQNKDEYPHLELALYPQPLRSRLKTLAEVVTRHFSYMEEAEKKGNPNWTFDETIKRCVADAKKLTHLHQPFDAIALHEIIKEKLCYRCLNQIGDRVHYCSDHCKKQATIFRNQVKKGIKKAKRLPHVVTWLKKAQDEKREAALLKSR